MRQNARYLFIDGGCLRAVLDRYSAEVFGGDPIELQYQALVGGHEKVFYYDAIPGKRHDETAATYEARVAPAVAMMDAMALIDGAHVYEGDARIRRRQQVQKKIDVMIAVDMLTHSFRRNMASATLLASDLDFKPLVDALVQDGATVTLWHPRPETNEELVRAADSSRPLDLATLHELATPEFQTKWRRPKIWNSGGDPLGAPLRSFDLGAEGVLELYDVEGLAMVRLRPPRGSMFHIRGEQNMVRHYARDRFGIDIAP